MGALALVLDVVFLVETYLKSILQKSAGQIRKETGNFAIHDVSEEEIITFKDLVEKYLLLPLKFLFLEPIVFLITIYTALVYGVLYLFLLSIPDRLRAIPWDQDGCRNTSIHRVDHWRPHRLRHRHLLRATLQPEAEREQRPSSSRAALAADDGWSNPVSNRSFLVCMDWELPFDALGRAHAQWAPYRSWNHDHFLAGTQLPHRRIPDGNRKRHRSQHRSGFVLRRWFPAFRDGDV